MCIRTIGNLTRQFKTNKAHLRYKRLATCEGSFYINTLFTKINICLRIYVWQPVYNIPQVQEVLSNQNVDTFGQ